jgi:phosphomannomutase
MTLSCFKAYDVRGVVPDELNADVAERIGRAYAQILGPATVILGHDVRLTSPALADALAEGLMAGGADVVDIGLCGTEEVYFATGHGGHDGGIMVTASHNPMEYNGIKFVREGARPISADSGLLQIRDLAVRGDFDAPGRRGRRAAIDARPDYIRHLLSYVDPERLKPLRIAMNPGNGGAGLIIEALQPHLPFEIVETRFEPDGNFPGGIPNPLLPECREPTANLVRESGAAMGVAWDGDFDRCFLFDENGGFIEGYYIVGLLAAASLRKTSGEKIVYDPRLTWNTLDLVNEAGGTAVLSKAGHSFIKDTMRRQNAVYGGEMSAHHYFREFFYCDSGMIPWLLVAEMLSATGKPLSELVAERMRAYPCSGELNYQVEDTGAVIDRISRTYSATALSIDHTDGVGFEFERWRFNLRPSNTEPVLRLNVEAREDQGLVSLKVAEIEEQIRNR